MTVEHFLATIDRILDLEDQYELQADLNGVGTNLTNLVSSPASTSYQSSLASALETFSNSSFGLTEALTPSDREQLQLLGGEDFFSIEMEAEVKNAIATNAMTPSVASNLVQKLVAKRQSFLKTLRSTADGLKELGIQEASVKAGSAEFAFMIPREIFDNDLGGFSKELQFVDRFLRDLSEALDGVPERFNVEQLSSSAPTVALGASIGLISAVATIVGHFLESWEKIQRVRKVRLELADLGIEEAASEHLDARIDALVSDIVRESTDRALASFQGDVGRRNELDTALQQHIRRLFAQIEMGLKVQFRASNAEAADADPSKQEALKNVQQVGQYLQYPIVDRESLLLPASKILEGHIPVSAPKKTAKTKRQSSPARKQPIARAEMSS